MICAYTLLAPEKEICLRNYIYPRREPGNSEPLCQLTMWRSPAFAMDRCYGLSIHEKEDAWRSYATIWEDEVAQAAEVELAEVTSEKLGDPDEQLQKKSGGAGAGNRGK